MSTTLPRRVDDADDDLFAETKMSFGDHLNELRVCLFKAVIALGLGFAIGLLVGQSVVKWIQTPLEKALTDYYQKADVDRMLVKLDERAKNGEAIPPELATKAGIEELVLKKGLLFEESYVMPEEFFNALKREEPKLFEGIEWPKPAQQPQAEKPADEKPADEAVKTGAATGDAPPDKDDSNGEAAALPTPKLLRMFIWHRADEDDRIKIKSMNAQEVFMIYMKAALIAGAVIASPAIFYFIWSFVAAGLYPHEKRYIHVFLPVSVGLFLGGVLVSSFAFKPVLGFFFSFNQSMGIDPDPRISEWLGFVLLLPLGFGVSFQLPLVMLFLERIGVFTVEAYLTKWRIAVLVIAIASMFLSPGGDPYSMLMLFIPLTILYFAGIAVCYYLSKSRPKSPRTA